MKSSTKWKPGQSGNTKGRPKGTGEVGKLRAAIAKEIPEILKALIEKAKGGDLRASALLLERVLPPMRAIDPAAPIEISGDTLTGKGDAILKGVSSGELTPGQASQLLTGLAGYAKLVETDDLAKRLAELEAHFAGKP